MGVSKEQSMPFQSTSHVPTLSGSRYLQQLCKHWSHTLAVDFTPQEGTVTFPRDARGKATHLGNDRGTK